MFLYDITLASKPTGATTITFVGGGGWELSVPPRKFTGSAPVTTSFTSLPPRLPIMDVDDAQIQVNWKSEAGSGFCKNSVKVGGASGVQTQTLTSKGGYVIIRVGGSSTYESGS